MPDRPPSKRSPFELAWRARFELFASLRDDDAGIAGWSTSGLETRFQHFERAWRHSGHGKTWVDAGCGAGTYSRFLAREGAMVIGLDYSWPTVTKARERDDAGCHWAVADVTQLPLRAGNVDGAVCFGVMQALQESGPAIAELSALLRPGGELWVDVLNAYCIANSLRRLVRWLRGKPAHLRYESPWRVRRLMRAAGLCEVQPHWIPIVPGRFRRLQAVLDGRLSRAMMHALPGFGALLSHSCMLRGVRPVAADEARSH